MKKIMAPSAIVLDACEQYNIAAGNENLGFLSREYGLVPKESPKLFLPDKYKVWDDLAAEIGYLYKTARVRQAINQLPEFDASREALPDEYLCRAALLFGIFAHTYCWCEFSRPQAPPITILDPWKVVCERMKRKEVTLSFNDLYLYNWRFRNPQSQSRALNNLDLLVDIYNTPEEKTFNLTMMSIVGQSSPIILSITETQNAIVQDDLYTVKLKVAEIIDCFRNVNQTITEITPARYAKNAFHPVVFARCIATLARPISPNTLGAGGGGMPLIHLMDVFLGREKYESNLGKEEHDFVAQADSPHIREFLGAVNKTSLKKYVFKCQDTELMGLYSEVVESFAGDRGLLGLHRRKALGFLESATKSGKIETTSRFQADIKNVFEEKSWNTLYTSFKKAESERFYGIPFEYPSISCARRSSVSDRQMLTFQLKGSGLKYHTGDHIQIMSQNNDDLVRKTFLALNANGNELVKINKRWEDYLAHINHKEGDNGKITLSSFLKLAHIRPIAKESLVQLYQASHESRLKEILDNGSYENYELHDVLSLIRPSKYNVKRLLLAPIGHSENLSGMVPPLAFRTYSLSSAPINQEPVTVPAPEEAKIFVRALEYPSRITNDGGCPFKHGVASNFLTHEESQIRAGVPAMISPTIYFHLPKNPNSPTVMFASGTGVAAFIAFIEEAFLQKRMGKLYLFLSVQDEESISPFREQLETWIQELDIEIYICCTQEKSLMSIDSSASKKMLITKEYPNAHIRNVMLDPVVSSTLYNLLLTEDDTDLTAYFFVCGIVGFYKTVYETLAEIIKIQSNSSEIHANVLYQLSANNRFVESVYTSYYDEKLLENKILVSDLVQHNNESKGCWMLINDRIYDVTDFLNLHPGGHIPILNNVGMDATSAFESIEHHLDSSIRSRLNMYLIGQLKNITFKTFWKRGILKNKFHIFSLQEFYQYWVKTLFQTVEMQNSAAMLFDYFPQISQKWKESPLELLAFQCQSAAENHRVFLNLYLKPLFVELNELWSATASLYSSSMPIFDLKIKNDALLSSSSYKIIEEFPSILFEFSYLPVNHLDEMRLHHYEQLLDSISKLDQDVLRDVKEVLRQGIINFETHVDNVLKERGENLIALLLKTSNILEGYIDHFATQVDKWRKTAQ